MARVIYGGGVTEFIGSIGGTTYQSNGSGFVARSKPKLRLRRTSAQVSQLSKFSYYSQLYRDLSGSDRATWEAFAIANTHTNLWGKTSIVNGLHWFIVINSQLISQGSSIINSAPTYIAPTLSAAFTLTIGAGSLVLNTATTFGSANHKMQFIFYPPLRSVLSEYRKLTIIYIPVTSANVGTYDISAEWESATGFSIASDLNATGNITKVGISLVRNICEIPSEAVFNS